jgi:hypothetical protein
LTPFSEAVATCAGDYASRLNIEPPERRRKKPLPPPDTPEGIRARAIEATRPAAVAEVHRRTCRAGNDADHVARYCVSMHPENPDEWKAVFENVHRDAAALVHELKCTIHKLAIRLFHDSEITLPGDPGHDEYFSGTVAGE